MSSDPHDTPFGPAALARAWSDFGARMSEAGLAWTSHATPPDAFRQMRETMLRAWADYCDQFMRSNDFLAIMRQSLDGAIQARRQLNDFLGQAQHEFQGASRPDIDKIMDCLERLDERLAEESDRVAARLDELSARLARVERTADGGEGTSKAKRTANRTAEKP